MVQSVLGSITLGYRPLWGRSRELAGVQLRVAAEPAMPVDAPHLLHARRTLERRRAAAAAVVRNPQLLADLLAHGDARAPQIEIPGHWLASHAPLRQRSNSRTGAACA
jgi:hypothetical protein